MKAQLDKMIFLQEWGRTVLTALVFCKWLKLNLQAER